MVFKSFSILFNHDVTLLWFKQSIALVLLGRMEREKQLLNLCCRQIEQMLEWGNSEDWTNDDFEQLSEKIFGKTKVQLSVSTLKRLWGKVRYENFPATSTLNALAVFLGYENWRAFRQKNDLSKIKPPIVNAPIITGESALPAPGVIRPTARKTYIMLGTAGLVVVACLIIFVLQKKSRASIDLSRIKFEALKVSDTLPNSVIFNYDASAFHSDSVYIQQSWDPRRRERVDGNAKQYTSIYYNPGYFIAKLIVNNDIKKECIVNIQTHGWKGIIEKDPVPTYLSAKECRANGFLGISAALLQQKTGTPVFNDTWVKFANVHDFATIDPDNFVFETSLRNTSAVEASVCRRVNVLLLLKGSAIILPLCDKGCISDINLFSGETWISGKDHDLSAFGCDFSQLQHLKCTVEGRHLKVYLNDRKVLDLFQKYKLNPIAGIRFEFEGAGEIKNVKLTTPGAGSYEDNF